jgi:hypothetical protein
MRVSRQSDEATLGTKKHGLLGGQCTSADPVLKISCVMV